MFMKATISGTRGSSPSLPAEYPRDVTTSNKEENLWHFNFSFSNSRRSLADFFEAKFCLLRTLLNQIKLTFVYISHFANLL